MINILFSVFALLGFIFLIISIIVKDNKKFNILIKISLFFGALMWIILFIKILLR